METSINTLPIGTVIMAKYTYGGEILHWKFYAILGYTRTKVKIQEIDSLTTYDDGKEGPHYYDAPKHIQPVIDTHNHATLVGKPKLVNYKVSNDGKMTCNPEEYYRYIGPWDGKPQITYNLH